MLPKSRQPSDISVNEYYSSVPKGPTMMMDDGPLPMKNMKPTKKQANGADQFKQEHKAEHDKPSDKCKRVDEHNKACPKLEDELDKRRSTGKVSQIQLELTEQESNDGRRMQKSTYYDPKCPKCVKERQAREKKKAQESKKKPRAKKSRVCKTRRPYRRRMSCLKLSNSRTTNRECCRFDSDIAVMTRRSPAARLSINMGDEKAAPKRDVASVKSRGQDSRGASNASNTDMYGNHSNPSVMTSYNSFQSMDHEPMVSP